MLEAQNSATRREARRLLQHFLSGAISKNDKSQGKRTLKPSDPKLQRETFHIDKEVCSVESAESAKKTESIGRKTVTKVAKLQWLKG